ncbi:MAG: hypothetical protein VX911_00920, partial [Candidatus Latescibacterota bacterium]|nr:hypothetical protein [Candidatus Latescibacterota bacterium]MEE2831031.1 hypothetical protein [Candidatus Latescibacterota bacterium]
MERRIGNLVLYFVLTTLACCSDDSSTNSPAENLPPSVINPLADLTFTAGDSDVAIDLAAPAVFVDPNGDSLTLTAGSSDTGVATAILDGTNLTISPIGVGTATVTVTADDGLLTADNSFAVEVKAPGGSDTP